MKTCKNCGVELAESLKVCPLCGKDPDESLPEEEETANSPSEIIRLYRKELRVNFLELSGIIAFSGIIVCTMVDLITGKGLKWSLYTDVSLLSCWIILSLLINPRKRPIIIITGLLVTILSMLFLFDLFSDGLTWFLPLGLPFTLAAFICLSIVVFLRTKLHFQGFNLLAIIFLITGLYCIFTEMIIDRYMHINPEIRWSYIAAVSIIPIALILFFLHYRMKKGNRLDSFFHI